MKKIKSALQLIIVIAVIAGICLSSYSESVNKELAGNIIRLHVVANSDSEEDQALKLDVRDKILEYLNDKLKGSKDIESSTSIILENRERIKDLALEEVRRRGNDYDITVSFGKYPFPSKRYGDLNLPAGMYNALRVSIGKGTGTNWWCVLFPPLCFTDLTQGTLSDEVKNELKESLSEEEYNIILAADSDSKIPIKIKFKVVEFFQNSKIKFTGAISRIFGGDDDRRSF
jgi:stage II sporulation protein R